MTLACNTDEQLRIERGMMAQHTISISEIVRDTSLQPRAQLDSGTIQEYADAIKAGAEFPPVDIWETPEGMLLSSGFHRVAAYETAGVKNIPAEIHQGTRRDALWHAVGENKSHGNRRKPEDTARAVSLALADPELSTRSNRVIADHIGVGETTVRRHRDEFNCASGAVEKTIGKDGKARPAKTKSPEAIAAAEKKKAESKAKADAREAEREAKRKAKEEVERKRKEEKEAKKLAKEQAAKEEKERKEREREEAKRKKEEQAKLSVKDGLGNEVTDQFADAFRFSDKCKEWCRRLDAIRKEIFDACESNVPGSAFIHPPQVKSDIANAKRHIDGSLPFAVCPWCSGAMCSVCRNSGYVTKLMYEKRPKQ